MTGADVRHFFCSADRFVVNLAAADPFGDEALVRIAERRSDGAHGTAGKHIEHMLWRHLF